ncbi:MAG TPA: (2Fe-2S)-binding protein [Gammaproteobacteria bacterium]|nr:(2Fe-2S)-binding protein [Gammaproteobacteria bacterium]
MTDGRDVDGGGPKGGAGYAEPRYDDGGIAGLAARKSSRRQFIKGVIASGAVASSAGFLFAGLGGCSGGRVSSAGGVERMLMLNVNGQMRPVDVLPNETLAMTLRYKLGLTGTKLGCDRGECGACTVLVDDVPHYSCSTLTHAVRSKAITTIEGLEGPNGELHAVQEAMIAELGPQCGFCTPGQIMSAVGLLKANPKPTRDEARHWMSGNLCRCGAYDHYLNAIMRAANGDTISQAKA